MHAICGTSSRSTLRTEPGGCGRKGGASGRRPQQPRHPPALARPGHTRNTRCWRCQRPRRLRRQRCCVPCRRRLQSPAESDPAARRRRLDEVLAVAPPPVGHSRSLQLCSPAPSLHHTARAVRFDTFWGAMRGRQAWKTAAPVTQSVDHRGGVPCSPTPEPSGRAPRCGAVRGGTPAPPVPPTAPTTATRTAFSTIMAHREQPDDAGSRRGLILPMRLHLLG